MYSPIKDGMEKTVSYVRYTEAKPPAELSSLVHCYWELKTEQILVDDFSLLAVPDACVNILFNQLEPAIAGVTALRTEHEVLPLGKFFHYAGIQFLPGVWQGKREELMDRFVGTPYLGALPLVRVSRAMASRSFSEQHSLMSQLVHLLIEQGLVVPNPITENILQHLHEIRTVQDMASLVGLSPRQLQRSLKQSTGFTPHDLLKVLRLQQSFKQHYLDLYADQSHYVHAFRKITGHTPAQYVQKFDVRFIQYTLSSPDYTFVSNFQEENAVATGNAIGWFDIYVNDLGRAVKFYETLLDQKLQPIIDPTGETQMMSFPADMNRYGASGALVKAKYSQPGVGGSMLYFSVEDCSVQEARLEAAGGKLIRPKFSIGEFGWVTLAQDSEGNFFGLNSMK